jgi:hypothetical protein
MGTRRILAYVMAITATGLQSLLRCRKIGRVGSRAITELVELKQQILTDISHLSGPSAPERRQNSQIPVQPEGGIA